jgi:hypothetical protein
MLYRREVWDTDREHYSLQGVSTPVRFECRVKTDDEGVGRAVTRNNFGNTGFLCFEHVTMVPIQTKLVDPARLSKKELEWLNKYNEEVRVKLTEGVRGSGDTEALRWLERETRAVELQ